MLVSDFNPFSSEKPERTLRLSVHAEGATKVLCVIDSSYHIFNDMKNSSAYHLREQGKHAQKQDKLIDYKGKKKKKDFNPFSFVSLGCTADNRDLFFFFFWLNR